MKGHAMSENTLTWKAIIFDSPRLDGYEEDIQQCIDFLLDVGGGREIVLRRPTPEDVGEALTDWNRLYIEAQPYDREKLDTPPSHVV